MDSWSYRLLVACDRPSTYPTLWQPRGPELAGPRSLPCWFIIIYRFVYLYDIGIWMLIWLVKFRLRRSVFGTCTADSEIQRFRGRGYFYSENQYSNHVHGFTVKDGESMNVVWKHDQIMRLGNSCLERNQDQQWQIGVSVSFVVDKWPAQTGIVYLGWCISLSLATPTYWPTWHARREHERVCH